jgi:hypothetical protein
MSSEREFSIEARIDHLSDGVGCFDPIQVMHRMRGPFPELIEESRDYLAETYEGLRRIAGDGTPALRIAIRDMQERGPRSISGFPCPMVARSEARPKGIGCSYAPPRSSLKISGVVSPSF